MNILKFSKTLCVNTRKKGTQVPNIVRLCLPVSRSQEVTGMEELPMTVILVRRLDR
jgi:hypothetical protein